MPDIPFNATALVACTVAGFLLSFLWYTPLFGKAWAREMGLDPSEQPATPGLIKSLLLTVLSVFLIAFVLASSVAVWTPSTWGIAGKDMPPAAQALQAGFFTWLGFFLPTLLHGVAWEKRSWKLFCINAGYYLTLLLVLSFIMVYLR
ncbi:MAG: DUF1761 domain-containing protein [Rhodoferax sp.]|nr:DUF1761 domain-containing protein [Rhodoferax sp.]